MGKAYWMAGSSIRWRMDVNEFLGAQHLRKTNISLQFHQRGGIANLLEVPYHSTCGHPRLRPSPDRSPPQNKP